MNNSLANKLEVWGFEDDTIIFKDGSLGVGLALVPIDASCLDGGDIQHLSTQVGHFLNGLPEGMDLQFVQEIKAGNEKVIGSHEELGKGSQDPLVENLLTTRANKYRDLDKAGLLPKHGLKVFIRKPFEHGLMAKGGLLSKAVQFPDITQAALKREIRKLARIRDDLMASFEGIGLRARTLGADQIVSEVYNQWNPARAIPIEAYDPTDIRTHLVFTDAHVAESGFSLSDVHHKVISLKILPGQTYMTMSQGLRDLPFDSKLFLSIKVPVQQREIESLQMQRRLTFSMVYGKQTGVSDIESGAKLEDLEEILAQMIAQGEKVFHVGLNVLLRAKDKDELEDQVSQTLLKIRELSGAEGMEEGLAAFDIFSNFAIPNAKVAERIKRMKTSNLKDILPLFGPWAGHSEARVLLRSRMGSLVKFDPFSAELTNANQLISGGSGSGKSFLTNLLLIQMLKENPKAFIIDIGGSYQKICESLSGQYIPLGLDEGIRINPFDLKEGEETPNHQKIKFLLALVESMTKEEGSPGLMKLEKSEVEAAIQQVYQGNSQPRLSHLRDALINHELPEVSRIGRILSSWCGESPYGQLLDCESNIKFDRPIVCFDLKGLENYPDLQSSCLLIITDLVLREVAKDRTQMKFIIFDECWKLIDDKKGEGAQFIGSVFRTCRKYFTSCIAISQNLDDFAKSKIATAVMSNSSIKWILKQTGADKARLQEVLDLNDSETDLIFSLQQKRGEFSEAFLLCEDHKSVVAVESTPQEYWLATSDPKDLSLLESFQKRQPDKSHLQVLADLAEAYPNGANFQKGGPE